MKAGPPVALAGVEVDEAGDTLATRVCARLLAGMGARVARTGGATATAADRLGVTDEGRVSALAGVPAVRLVDDEGAQALSAADRGACIVTTITALGRDAAIRGERAGELALQARGGLMAVTGEAGGAPQPVRVPVAAMLGGLVAATATLAALRHRRRGGAAQSVDVCLLEVLADQLRTQASLVFDGRADGYRAGSRHPVCAPWNAYRAADGWAVICSASDAQWRALARCIDPALADDPRFATVEQRRRDVDALDGLIGQWTRELRVADIVARVEAADVPVGPVATVEQLHRAVLADDPRGVAGALRSPVRYTPQPGDAGGPPPSPGAPGDAPLAGIRVVELSRYAAGPLAGTLLAALGAEVIKVEAPGGEDCRAWAPRFGDTSGYFANYNTGKRSVVLDLSTAEGRESLWQLVDTADVLLSNLRPGVMDRLGFTPAALAARRPALVQAEISGYGRQGPRTAALDTVIQAQSGLLSLVGLPGAAPCRVGLSIADQVAGHFAAQGIVAALECRDREGCGGLVDVPMIDAATWLTLAAWPDGHGPLDGCAVLRAQEGWVVSEPASALPPGLALHGLDREAAVQALARVGVRAHPVREPGEVFGADPVLPRRGSAGWVPHPCGARVPVLRAPLGLAGTPVRLPERLSALGEDTDALAGAPAASHATGDPA